MYQKDTSPRNEFGDMGSHWHASHLKSTNIPSNLGVLLHCLMENLHHIHWKKERPSCQLFLPNDWMSLHQFPMLADCPQIFPTNHPMKLRNDLRHLHISFQTREVVRHIGTEVHIDMGRTQHIGSSRRPVSSPSALHVWVSVDYIPNGKTENHLQQSWCMYMCIYIYGNISNI